jgi:hypothetical protein
MVRRMSAFLALFAALLAPPGQGAAARKAQAKEPAVPAVEGTYDSPLGRVSLAVAGARVTGRILTPSRGSPFAAGEEVLRATQLDDSLAGELKISLLGEGCGLSEAWESLVLLIGPRELAGAVHVAEPRCGAPVGPKGGVLFVRVRGEGGGEEPGTVSKGRREAARRAVRDGAAWLLEGNFEAARRQFLSALEQDPRVPEAMNGVGVTYRMRNDLGSALGWYKKALSLDPDFGDAYYNMACIYALKGEKGLALRYLQIASLNGYQSAEGIDADPDLVGLHEEPAYRALVKAQL